MVCTYDFSGNCRAIRLCKPEIFEYRGFSPRITANSRDRELSLPQFALFVLFLPRLLRYTLEIGLVMGHWYPLPTSPKRGKGCSVFDKSLDESFAVPVLILAFWQVSFL